MLYIFILLFTVSIILSGITTIPLFLPLLIVWAVIFRKPSVFFVAFVVGFFLDLLLLRPLGQTGLILVIAIFTVFLYEKKFETQTATFVFFASFLWSLIYLKIFGYENIFLQALINSLLAVLTFRLSQNSKGKSQKYN